MISEKDAIAVAEECWSTISFDADGHQIYHFERDYLLRFAQGIEKAIDEKRYESADDLDAEIHRLLELKIERLPEYAKSLLALAKDGGKGEAVARDAERLRPTPLRRHQFIKRDTENKISITFKTPEAADQYILSLVDAEVNEELERLGRADGGKGNAVHDNVKQFLADVSTAAGLVAHGRQCKALSERLGNGCAHFYAALAAPQAECAPRALTDEEMLDAIAAVCSFDRAGVERWKTEALLIGRAIEQAVKEPK